MTESPRGPGPEPEASSDEASQWTSWTFRFEDPGNRLFFATFHDLLTDLENLVLVAFQVSEPAPTRRRQTRKTSDEPMKYAMTTGSNRAVSQPMSPAKRSPSKRPQQAAIKRPRRWVMRPRLGYAPRYPRATYFLTRVSFASGPEIVVAISGSLVAMTGASAALLKITRDVLDMKERIQEQAALSAEREARISRSTVQKTAYDLLTQTLKTSGSGNPSAKIIDRRQFASAARALTILEGTDAKPYEPPSQPPKELTD